jgi:exonuclease III
VYPPDPVNTMSVNQGIHDPLGMRRANHPSSRTQSLPARKVQPEREGSGRDGAPRSLKRVSSERIRTFPVSLECRPPVEAGVSHAPLQLPSPQVDEQAGDWILVQRQRLSRRKQEANWRDERSIVVWGVERDLLMTQFDRLIGWEGLSEILDEDQVRPEWFGAGDSRRVQLLCESDKRRRVLLSKLAPAVRKYGWRAVLSRTYWSRKEQRGEQVVEGESLSVRPPSALLPRKASGQQKLRNYFQPLSGHPQPAAVAVAPVQVKAGGLRCGSWNARALNENHPARVAEIAAHLTRRRIDICAVQEARLGKGKTINPKGFKWVGRETSGFLVSQALAKSVQVVEAEPKHPNQFWIKIPGGTGFKDMYLCSVYMPQSADTANARDAFATLKLGLSMFRSKGFVVLLGDFNAHCGRPTNESEAVLLGAFGPVEVRNANGRLLVELLKAGAWSSNCRVQRPSLEYTRMDPVSSRKTVIDYAIVSSELISKVVETRVDYTDLDSDHHLVVLELKDMKKKGRKKSIVVKSWRRSKLTARSQKKQDREAAEKAQRSWQAALEEGLINFNPEAFPVNQSGADQVLDDWRKRVDEAGMKNIGKKKVVKRFSQKWFDKELRAVIAERRAKHQEYRKSGELARLYEYYALRKKIRRMTAKKRKAGWVEAVDKIVSEFKSHSKLFWSLLSGLVGGQGSRISGPLKNAEGTLVFEEGEKKEVLAAFYEKLGLPVEVSPTIREDGGCVKVGDEFLKHRFDDSFKRQVEEKVRGLLGEAQASMGVDDIDRLFTDKEVLEVLKALCNGKACGGDGIPPEFLKYGGSAMVKSLRALFNWFLKSGHMPEMWGKAIVVLLYKKGDPADPGNYRGISLLDVVGKVFTKLVAQRIEEKIKDVIVEEQAGFTAKKGCTEHIFVLDQILRGRKAEGKDTFLFFLDVRKAFDTVWRDGLLLKLWEAGVRGRIWSLVKAMYANNYSAILSDGSPSRWFKIWQGVRQGDSASPSLFKLFVNDLAVELKAQGLGVSIGVERLQALLFADDIVLLAENLEDLQKMIDVVARYSVKWRFRENLGKCGVMEVFAKKPRPLKFTFLGMESTIRNSIPCSFLGQKVAWVAEYQYLGVYFHEDLNWNRHVEYLLGKVKKRVAKYMRVFRSRDQPVELRLVAWEVIVLPMLLYGSEVWFCSNSNYRSKLETIQNEVARAILHCSSKASTIGVNAVLGLAPLWLRRAKRMLSWRGRLAFMPGEALAARVEKISWGQVAGRKGPKPRSYTKEVNVWLKELGLQDEYVRVLDGIGQDKGPKFDDWMCSVKGAMQSWLEEKFETTACQRSSQLQLLRRCQTTHGLEDWLKGPLKGIKLVHLRFCLGSHALRGHLARRCEDSEEKRTVSSCVFGCKAPGGDDAAVEDVEHFILDCEGYADLRVSFRSKMPQVIDFGGDRMEETAFFLGLGHHAHDGWLNHSLGFLQEAWKRRSEKLSEVSESVPEAAAAALRASDRRGARRPQALPPRPLRAGGRSSISRPSKPKAKAVPPPRRQAISRPSGVSGWEKFLAIQEAKALSRDNRVRVSAITPSASGGDGLRAGGGVAVAGAVVGGIAVDAGGASRGPLRGPSVVVSYPPASAQVITGPGKLARSCSASSISCERSFNEVGSNVRKDRDRE